MSTAEVSIPDVDALVVGAGPAGCVAARQLAAGGASVLLVERSAAPRDKVCGEYLCPSAVGALRRLDLLGDLPRSAGRAIHGMLLVAPDGAEVATRFPVAGPPPAALSVPRPALEAHLERHARQAGAQVSRGVALLALDPVPGGMEAVLRTPAGRGQRLRARVVVGADGRHSAVARRAGLARPAAGPVRGVLHAWYEGPAPADCGEMHFFEDGSYLGLDPLADGRWNAGWVTDGATVAAVSRAKAGPERLRALFEGSPALRRRLGRARPVGEVRTLMPLRVDRRRTVADRVVLVGDAAGFYDPLTGEGIHAALETGDLAATVILAALARGRTDARALAPYHRQRRQLMRRKALTHHLLQTALRHPGWLDHVGGVLSQRPARGHDLIGVIGQLLPPTRLLRPRFWAPLLWPRPGAAR